MPHRGYLFVGFVAVLLGAPLGVTPSQRVTPNGAKNIDLIFYK